MQQRNLLMFMVVSILILVGWSWLQNKLWPPPLRRDNTQAKVDAKKGAQEHRVAAKAAPWRDLSPETRQALLIAAVITLPEAGLRGLHFRDLQAQLKPAAPEAPVEQIVLGGKDFFLTAVLTTKGGGVQKLTLNNFQAADHFGLSAHKPLDLVAEDPIYPSFLMYHFPDDNADHPPVLTLGIKNWKLEGKTTDTDGTEEVRFSTRAPAPFEHLAITRIYKLRPRDYHIGLAIEIKDVGGRQTGEPVPKFRYQLAGAHGVPIEGEWYSSTYRNAVIGKVDSHNGLWRTLQDSRRISIQEGGNRVPEGDRGETFLQYAGVMNQYFGSMIVVDNLQAPRDEGGVDMKSILAWARPTLETTELKGKLKSVARDTNRLVMESGGADMTFELLPRAAEDVEEGRFRVGDAIVVAYYSDEKDRRIACRCRGGEALRPFSDDITVRVNSELLELRPGEKLVHKFMLYNGPVKVRLLGQLGAQSPDDELIERYASTLHLSTLTDYGSFGFWTDLLIACTRVMHWLLHLLHFVVGSYGLTIILLTVVVRGLMFPISRKQAYLSVKMQELAPEMKKLQEKYKNDPKAKTEAMMALYRKHNVHPLGGCLPLLLQMPIFLGLYYALQESIHFRLASFLWIRNLAAPDMLLWWGQGIPWLSDPDNMGGMLYLGPYVNLLPVVAVALMIVQQKLFTPPPTDEQQEFQIKMMKYMMIFMGVMFYKVAAGLCLYFIASSLWGLAERKLLPRKRIATDTAAATSASTTAQASTFSIKPRKKDKKKEKEKEEGTMRKVKDWWEDILKQAKKK
jgi:YidC/Oxa1 family membrane protein insertase